MIAQSIYAWTEPGLQTASVFINSKNKKVDKETLDFLIDYLYIYSLSNEKKEFEALHEYYDGNSSKIEDFQEKITTELFQSHNLDKKLLKNFNSEKFILESIEDSDPNNALGKVFRVGIIDACPFIS